MAAPVSSAFGKPTKPTPQKERRRNRKKEKQGPSSSCLLLKAKNHNFQCTFPASLSILQILGVTMPY